MVTQATVSEAALDEAAGSDIPTRQSPLQKASAALPVQSTTYVTITVNVLRPVDCTCLRTPQTLVWLRRTHVSPCLVSSLPIEPYDARLLLLLPKDRHRFRSATLGT